MQAFTNQLSSVAYAQTCFYVGHNMIFVPRFPALKSWRRFSMSFHLFCWHLALTQLRHVMCRLLQHCKGSDKGWYIAVYLKTADRLKASVIRRHLSIKWRRACICDKTKETNKCRAISINLSASGMQPYHKFICRLCTNIATMLSFCLGRCSTNIDCSAAIWLILV
jgi:hypothetical protein